MLLFFTKALQNSQTDLGLELAGYTSETVHHAPRSRAYKTLDAFLTAVITSGSVTVQAFKNGVSVGTLVIDTDAHRSRTGLTFGVLPGDRVEAKVTTASALAPLTTDLLALIH